MGAKGINMVVTTVADMTSKVKEAIKIARNTDVLVGIPQKEDSKKGEITNAELLFIHTKGSPLKHIPARPVIEPAIEHDKDVINDLLKEALTAFLEGDIDKGMKGLEKAGMEGAETSKDWFDNPKNNWPPNSPATIKRKLKKGSTDPKPLIDTGEMRKSITYVVRKGSAF